MQYQPNLFRLLFIFIIFSAFLISCGGSSSGTGEALLRGTIADVVAKEQVSTKSFFVAKLKEILTFSKSAVAQDGMVDLSGITVEAFDGENNLVGEGESDENGNFEFTVPCNTPLTLVFMLDAASVEFGGIIVPCPEGEEEAVLFITVDLNFDKENGELEVEEEEDIANAQISCNGQDEEVLGMEGEDLVVDCGGKPWIITAGGCHLEIIAANVELTNCSICIDTRGNSWVKMETENFHCDSLGNGIRSVGTSRVEVELVAPEADAIEICDDAMDNDMDGDTDCDDSDCDSDPACGGPLPETDCEDVMDNDTDGFTDCDDPDCFTDPVCEGVVEIICDDEMDNDVDELTDCDDPDCAIDPVCAEPECGSLSIDAGENGVDTRGNSSVALDGEGDDDDDEGSACGDVSIIGGVNSIIAVGNSEVKVEGTSCMLDPEQPVEKGNAEVEVECDGDDDDDDAE